MEGKVEGKSIITTICWLQLLKEDMSRNSYPMWLPEPWGCCPLVPKWKCYLSKRHSIKFWFSELVLGWKRSTKSCCCFVVKKKKKSEPIVLASGAKSLQVSKQSKLEGSHHFPQRLFHHPADLRHKEVFPVIIPQVPFFLNVTALFTLFPSASFLYLGFYSLQVLEDGCHLMLFIHPVAKRTQKSY